MILVIGAIIAYGATSITLNEYTAQGTDNAMDDYSYNRARDIANGMVDIILIRFANDENYRVTSAITQNLDGGYASYTAESSFFEGDSLVKIIVAANYNGTTKTITAYAKHSISPDLDFNLSCITSNSAIKVNGLFLIDARDHTAAGVLIPQEGTYCMWSISRLYNPWVLCTGAGTFNNVDYAPATPPHPNVVAENQTWPGGFPTTPEGLFS